jgi:hypothetical protein
MKNYIKYIELKTEFTNNGTACIGKVEFSISKNIKWKNND